MNSRKWFLFVIPFVIGDKCFLNLQNISYLEKWLKIELVVGTIYIQTFLIYFYYHNSFVIADHKFDVSFMRHHESINCFQKMGIRLILMIAERRIRKTSTKENKIRISMILPHFRMCTIFFRVRNILRYNYAVIVH